MTAKVGEIQIAESYVCAAWSWKGIKIYALGQTCQKALLYFLYLH